MTIQTTKIYKRSFKGSVGAGAGALFGNTGKSYYILEHKTASKYHKEGEAQEIIVNQVELGRDPSCQIRFDESCQTVSRRHAAIVREGEGWKLIQLSTTNSTFLNGQKVIKEWYLRNGDEIQLSIDGPRLGFIVPAGSNATVGSIGLSRRLSLFRQQAMRPYRNALIIMGILFVSAIVGGGWMIFRQGEQHMKVIASFEEEIKTQKRSNENDKAQMKEDLDKVSREYNFKLDSILHESNTKMKEMNADLKSLIDSCKNDIYFLKVDEIYITDGKANIPVSYRGWSGTGFLLDDGKFVTARHCIQSWRFDTGAFISEQAAKAHAWGARMEAVVKAQNREGKTFSFKASDFIFNDFYDKIYYTGRYQGRPVGGSNALYALINGEKRIWSTDWAYIQTNEKGRLKADVQLSKELKAGAELHVLGFPGGIGSKDIPGIVEPPYNKFSVASDGLDNSLCILYTHGTDYGNSGGPVFTLKNNELVVIGIVSRGSSDSEKYAYGVPIANIYDRKK